jgi:hypothetical protein
MIASAKNIRHVTKPHFSVHDKIRAERLRGADSFKGLRRREGIVQMGCSAGLCALG